VTSTLFLIEMARNHAFSPDLQHTIDTRPDLIRDSSFMGPGEELRKQMVSEASARAQTATHAERDQLVNRYYDKTLCERSGSGSC